MKNYLLLIKGSFQEWNKIPKEAKDKHYEEFVEFAGKLREKGFLKGGDGCGERSFRIQSPEANNNDSLVPLETKDMVTGYFMLEVPNEEEALALAKQCPAFNCGEYVELVPCGH